MRSITKKIETLRRAEARTTLKATAEIWDRLRNNDVPKKDVLAVARCAGILAAKKTADLIPYCHPLLLDFVSIEFEFEGEALLVRAVVETVAKTGVEMEALTASSLAALTVYDMLKPLDETIEIVGTKLVSKTGGKSSFKEKIPSSFKAAVIVTSDSTFKGTRADKSGRLIRERLVLLGIDSSYEVVPDEIPEITMAIEESCKNGAQLVLTTGGTGLGPRDVTVEATRAVIDREIPGIMEAARGHGQKRTPYAMLSRGVAGQKGKSLIVNLPGSSKGVEESLDALFPSILHAYKMMKGFGHEPVSAAESRAEASV